MVDCLRKADKVKEEEILGEKYNIEDGSLRSLLHLTWKILFQINQEQIEQEEIRLKERTDAFRFFEKAYNIAYLLSVLNRQKLRGCRKGPLPNRYLPESEEDPYLFYKTYMGRDKSRDTIRYLNKWIPVYQK